MNASAWPTPVDLASGENSDDVNGDDFGMTNVMSPLDTHGCYSGKFGNCDECNMQGSCICASGRNGNSDFIPMDRSRWGDRVLTCPNYEPVLIAVYAIAAAASLLCALHAGTTLKFRINLAIQGQHMIEDEMVRLALICVIGAAGANAAFNIIKIALPHLLVGIDLLPSVCAFGRGLAMHVAEAYRVLHLFKVAFKAQEASVGRQRVAEMSAQYTRKCYTKVCFFVTFSMPVVVGALLAEFGYVQTTNSQIVLFFVCYVLDLLSIAAAVGLALHEGHELKKEFEKSIEAVEAARVVAAGGVAAMAVYQGTRVNGGVHPAVQAMSPQLLALEEELSILKRTNDSLQPIRPAQKVVICIGLTLLLLFCAVPMLWNKFSYMLAYQSIALVLHAHKVTQQYTRAEYRKEHVVQRI